MASTPADHPILYSFRRCPYAMRARMALWLSGLRVELREVELKDKPAAMLSASPKGTVPVLVLTDGTAIEESLEIMRWALNHNDPQGWLSPQTGDLRAMAHLIADIDGPFKDNLDRYKYASRYVQMERDTLAHRDTALEILQTVCAPLAVSGFLFGPERSLADMAIFPFVRQFRIADPKWFDALDLPHIQRWLDGLTATPPFQDVMGKYVPWREGDPPVIFGAPASTTA